MYHHRYSFASFSCMQKAATPPGNSLLFPFFSQYPFPECPYPFTAPAADADAAEFDDRNSMFFSILFKSC